MDSILENPIFQQGIFKEGGLQINYLRNIKKDLDKNLDSGKKDIIALSKKIEEFTKIKGTRGDRPSLSFSQMYELREAIETLKGKKSLMLNQQEVKSAITQKGLDQMNDVIKELDKFMTPQSVEDLLRGQSSFIKDSAQEELFLIEQIL